MYWFFCTTFCAAASVVYCVASLQVVTAQFCEAALLRLSSALEFTARLPALLVAKLPSIVKDGPANIIIMSKTTMMTKKASQMVFICYIFHH
jgi:hypothetical protein